MKLACSQKLWRLGLGLILLAPLAAAGKEPGSTDADARTLQDFQARQSLGLHLLDSISRSLPELLWLDRLTYDPETVTIQGRAFNTNAIASFIENLDRVKGFTEPTLVNVKELPDDIFSFSLRFERRGGAPTAHQATAAREAEMAETLRQIRDLVEQSSLEVTSFVSGPPVGSGSSLRVVPLDVRIVVASYHAAAMLFDRLNRFPGLVSLKKLTLAPEGSGEPKLAVDLILEVPVVP